jgi:hypothetical protein
MIIGRVALDLVMAGAVVSLISVAAFIVAGAAVAMATLLRARSRALRRRRQLSELNLTGSTRSTRRWTGSWRRNTRHPGLRENLAS